uniref:Uncharacterized protein n=1 Tax=Setaria viridis TaxID=4556 RepID=A0A4U6W8Y8_SETVI|nr:hypothetical protein SEVIR_1G040550v2 [Setaria viridis]
MGDSSSRGSLLAHSDRSSAARKFKSCSWRLRSVQAKGMSGKARAKKRVLLGTLFYKPCAATSYSCTSSVHCKKSMMLSPLQKRGSVGLFPVNISTRTTPKLYTSPEVDR